jgi:hypothetical protein
MAASTGCRRMLLSHASRDHCATTQAARHSAPGDQGQLPVRVLGLLGSVRLLVVWEHKV